jgi:hypothetical protein
MDNPRILHLTLSLLPFQAMVSGEKKSEYRSPSKWILSRLKGKKYDYVKFSHGNGKDSPYFIAEYRGWQTVSKPGCCRYSNGLVVHKYSGMIRISIGEIVERSEA